MKKIRVLQMIDQTFLGGGQVHLLALARLLDRQLFEVSACSREGGPLVEGLKKQGIPHFPVAFSKRCQKHIMKDLVSLMNTHHFDILHTHGGVAGFYGRWAARKCVYPARVVHTLHGIHYLHYRNVLLKCIYILLEQLLARISDAVVFVSDADRELGRRYKLVPPNKQVVITNGIDVDAFQEEARFQEKLEGIAVDSTPCIVGTVARLHRQKGLPYLLRAAVKIQESIPETKVWIVGGGPLFQKLHKLQKKLALENTVQFLGERKEVAALLARFDIFVLSSLWEGLPYSLMEAGALAKPVVATDIDGVRELVKHGETGLLVPVKDSERLAQSVIRLLRDKECATKLGKNLKTAIRQHTLSRMIQKIQDLYLGLLRQ